MRYDAERACVMLPVTELCSEALRCGNLDLRFGGAVPRSLSERMSVGAEVHRALQAEAGSVYMPEVPLSHSVLFHELCYEVSGRADGILATDPPTVDEIKTVSGRRFELPPAPQHDAQVRCYAYFLCCQKKLSLVQTRLTYVRTEDRQIKHVTTLHTREELERFFLELLTRIEYRARILCERQTVLLPSAADCHFPFPSLRRGQEELIRACYRAVRSGKRLFAEAPTGIGKTLSTLYPAVRAVGEGHADKIFYLTAKASTRREAFRAASHLFAAGAHLRTVVLTAREQICSNALAKRDPLGVREHCNPMDCPRAKGFYDRCPNAICSLLSAQSGYSRRTVEEVAERFQICPYELQLELSELCDIVICDYNYVFDPHTYLRRYFAPEAGGDERYVLLVDEAHNLVDRARGMYSAALCSQDVADALALLEPTDPLREPLEGLKQTMYGFRRLCSDTLEQDANGVWHGYYLNHGSLDAFGEQLRQTASVVVRRMQGHRTDVAQDAALRKLCGVLQRMETVFALFDRAFLTFVEVEGEQQTIRLICMDPSCVLDERMQRAHAAVLFSATLTPLDYFSDVLGGGKGALRLSLPSPFDPEHFCLTAVTGISTRYEDRARSCKQICTVIAAVASAKRGNYIVYFPSYDYMESVYQMMKRRYPDVILLAQKRGMTQAEREHFLEAFVEDQALRIGFCVLGGSFAEGVDLPGRRLIGSVIVGTGLPSISNEQNLLRDHYEVTRERGYDYAYVYPGMNRVMQAAGRVIRREEDRGVVVLIDDRYADARLQAIFPEHWQNMKYAGSAHELAEIVRDFWRKF